jgi:hypothetical protein
MSKRELGRDPVKPITGDSSGHIMVPGRNCWRKEPAHRVKFLIDGQAYFNAFMEAVAHARWSIVIIGWDINGRIKLKRDTTGDPETEEAEEAGTLVDFARLGEQFALRIE